MKKLITILIYQLLEDECAQFCRAVMALLLASGTSLKNAVTAARIAAFKSCLDRLEALMLWPGMKVITAKVAAADRTLDHALSALAAQLRNIIRYSPAPVLAEAATRVQAMLERYGKVSRKNYEAQSGDLKSILENLNGAYAADVTALGIGGLKDALQAAFNSFTEMLTERDTIESAKPKDPKGNPETFAKVKKAVAEIYREIAVIVNSGAKLDISTDFDVFIDALNPEIERLNRAHRRVRRDIKHATIVPIPDQGYTGLPVTPLVKVYFETKEGTILLELGKDYNVTYKANVDVGNAKCIVSGKAGYKGTKEITFMIKRGGNNAG